MTTYAAVIPTGGERESVRGAVESAVHQSCRPAHVYVVCTSPAARADVEAQVGGFNDVSVHTVDAQGLANVARQHGVALAGTEFIAFLDDDDWWEVNKMERQMALASLGNLDVVSTACVVHARHGNTTWPLNAPGVGQNWGQYLFARRSLGAGWAYLPTSTLMIRRSLVEEIPFDLTLPRHQDWDWIVRVSQVLDPQKFGFVTAALTHIDQGAASVSRQPRPQLSSAWVEDVRPLLGRRGYGDAIVSTAVREVLDQGDLSQAARLVRRCLQNGGRPGAFSWIYLAVRAAEVVIRS